MIVSLLFPPFEKMSTFRHYLVFGFLSSLSSMGLSQESACANPILLNVICPFPDTPDFSDLS